MLSALVSTLVLGFRTRAALAAVAAAGLLAGHAAGAPKTGGCCFPNGSCTVTSSTTCASQGGSYRGNGTTCSPACPAPTGSCCAASGACTVQTQAQCAAAGGSWTSGGACSPSPCPTPIAAHGVLVRSGRDPLCLRFESDSGTAYILSTTGAAQAGDRVYVEGTIPTGVMGTCEHFALPRINVRAISPAFAGVGTLVSVSGQTRLRTDDGREYGLQNTGGLPPGSRVYSRGAVDTSLTPARITGNTIGAALAAFGRLVGPPSDRRFQSEAGAVYTLDGVGSFDAEASDYVYVEGILGAGNTVTSADARRAFSAAGVVIDNGAGGRALLADGILASDVFGAAGLEAYPVGARVYVRGRAPGDYDAGEARADQTVRQATVAPAMQGFGTLNLAARTVTDVDTGTAFSLENTGGLTDGTFVFVAGAVASTGAGSAVLGHNLILPGLELNGDLADGFECTPLLVSGGGYYVIENSGGFPIGSNVTVRGGLDRRAAPCDFDAIVSNSIILGLPDH